MRSCSNTTPREHKQPISVSTAALNCAFASTDAPSFECMLYQRAAVEQPISLSAAAWVDLKEHFHPHHRGPGDDLRHRLRIGEEKERNKRRCVEALRMWRSANTTRGLPPEIVSALRRSALRGSAQRRSRRRQGFRQSERPLTTLALERWRQ
jgi:hypothetical protein